MLEEFADIVPPSASTSIVTKDQVTHGPAIPPQQRILLYAAEEWESFIEEWAHFCLKEKYKKVKRFTGAGDKGIDIAGFVDDKGLLGVWDNYQCKRYLDHALYPSDAWPEIGKILWHSFKGEYVAPRHYYFVAPREVGTELSRYLSNAVKLKARLIEKWDANVRSKISDKFEVPLAGEFRAYVEGFDFSLFDSVNNLELIEDYRNTPYYSARFGGALKPRPAAAEPPWLIDPTESRYIEQLLSAYAEHSKKPVSDPSVLKTFPKLHEHFKRQREAFYHAESLRVFARETVPPGTFEALQDEIHSGVVNTCYSEHLDGYECVLEVTKEARQLQLTSNPLLTCAKLKDRDGIRHQLANEDRLEWTKS
jgi:hypothetical protein